MPCIIPSCANLLGEGKPICLEFFSQLFGKGSLPRIEQVVQRVKYGLDAPISKALGFRDVNLCETLRCDIAELKNLTF